MNMRGRWLLVWAIVGLAAGFGVSVVGIFTVPAALVAGVLIARRRGFGPETFGLLLGIGATLLLVAGLAYEGSGFNGDHWLAAGLAVGLCGIAGYRLSIHA